MPHHVHHEARLRAWAVAAAVGIVALDAGAAAADAKLDDLLTIARVHSPSWEPREDAGAIVLSTTLSGWEPSRHCLREVEGPALTTVERELAAVLGELRACVDVAIQIETGLACQEGECCVPDFGECFFDDDCCSGSCGSGFRCKGGAP